MNPIEAEIFTTQLTNSTLTISENDGITAISIFNTTATAGTVTGTAKIDATTSSAISITEGMTYSLVTKDAKVIKNLTIVAPAGCTLAITAER